MSNTDIRVFLGANSSAGFLSKFSSLYQPDGDWFAYIIKGGPGTGKSSFMKKAAEALEADGLNIIRVPCSSDPDSLDGVIFPEIRACICDGTAPHVMDPEYAGDSSSVVNLCDCWNARALREAAPRIIESQKKNKLLLSRAGRFISAAGQLLKDTYQTSLQSVNREKLEHYCVRLADAEFGEKAAEIGRETGVFLSGLTPKGNVQFDDTLHALCPRVILVEDDYGAAGRLILESLKSEALLSGHDVIAGYCPLFGEEKLEHLIIPSLGLGFFTQNSWLTYHFEPETQVRTARFYNGKTLKAHTERMNFNKRAAKELLEEAYRLLTDAKAAHDELEAHYVPNMDFEKVGQKCAAVIAELRERAAEKMRPAGREEPPSPAD